MQSKVDKCIICSQVSLNSMTFSVILVYAIASFGVLFKKNSASNYLKRQIGPSPNDEVLPYYTKLRMYTN